MTSCSPYFKTLRKEVQRLGGIHNAHLHLDRAGTLKINGLEMATASHLSIAAKHGLISDIHESASYDSDELRRRVQGYLETMVACGTTRADSLVDVTHDRVGTTAFETFLELSSEFAGVLDFQVGAYSPLGFTDQQPERWELLEEAARHAHFIGSLPERDDQQLYPDHIGFQEHCRRILQLADTIGKPVHIHVDQRNDPRENASELVIQSLRDLELRRKNGEPQVWLVHVISPSTYEERRFSRLVEAFVDLNIGVICCPSAALSMRQYRPLNTPTFNSIARILEMLAAGVHVRLGSDNVCDATSPAGTPDLIDEVFILSNALRYYDIDIMSKLSAGKALDTDCRTRIRQHLKHDLEEITKALNLYG